MNSTNRKQFLIMLRKEMYQLETMDALVAVPQHNAIYMVRKVINYVWAFKIKIYPDRLLKKHKYHICVRGDLQTEGVDYFDTYYPFVQYSTVRLLLIVACILNLETKQLDFTLDFVHAKNGLCYFIEIPKGFDMEVYVLELKLNLLRCST